MLLLPILTLKANGGFAVAMEFGRRAAATGERVVIVSSSFHGTDPLKDPQNSGLEFVLAPAWGGRIGALAAFFVRAITLSMRYRPRVVYTHIATTLIPDFSGERSVMVAQDLEYRFYTGALRWLAKRVFARAMKRSRLLVTSLWLAKYFRRQGCDILYSADVGVSRKMFVEDGAPSSEGRPFDVLLIAKRGAHKRRAEVLALARVLAERGRTVRLIDQAPDDQSPVAQPGIVVSGAVSADSMRDLYRRSHVFVGVSRAEGYGLTPLEALLQGCKVVTTPTPSTANLHHPALRVVAGSEDLVLRLAAVVETSIDDALAATTPSERCALAGRVPFMEDWGVGACAAFANRRA